MGQAQTSWLVMTVVITVGFILMLSTAATAVALFVKDPLRRGDAYRVLKLLLGVGGGAGLIATVTQLNATWIL